MRVEKSGWIKKQGGLVRSWQQRFAVLKDQSLSIYMNEDLSKLQGTIELTDAKVEEHPYNPEEPDRWIFEIFSLKSGRTNTYENHVLWASSKEERIGWLSALRRSIYGGKGGGVFGGSLQDVVFFDRARYNYTVPHIVKQCVEIIRENGRSVEGIFRLSGRSSLIYELRKRYDEGERPDLTREEIDIHTTAALLKMYFRELPEPVIPFKYFESFLDIGTSLKFESNHEKSFVKLRSLMEVLPEVNYRLLDYLTKFLNEISENKEVNKMDERNLALSFGPSILRSEDDSPEFSMAVQNITSQVFLTLVKFHNVVFSRESSMTVSKVELEKIASFTEESSTTRNTETNAADSNESLKNPARRHSGPVVVNDLIDLGNPITDEPVGKAPLRLAPQAPLRSKSLKARIAGGEKGDEEDKLVMKRTISARKHSRPAAVVHNSSSREPSLDTDQQPTSPRDGNELQLVHSVNHPCSQPLSLYMEDLPTNTEDLQLLVVSLKVQIKEQAKEMDRMKRQLDNLQKIVADEKLAKEEAINRVIELTTKLASNE